MGNSDASLVSLGDRIRRLRADRGMTLTALARAAGIAPSSLSKMEAGRMVPSILTMVKLARALGLRVSDFTGENDSGEPVVVTRAGQREHHRRRAGRFSGERLGGLFHDARLYASWLWIQTGGKGLPTQRPGEEMAVCLKGEVEFSVGEQTHLLHAGDVIHFRTDLPHRWRNAGRGEAQMILVVTPPPIE